jgi:transposase
VQGGAGRPPIDPAILIALWLYATLEGVGSARMLERLCQQHDAYRWLCGGVSVNYHTLADFRVAHGAFLDQLTVGVATLISEGLVTMKRVAQDGVRIRASAGAASFRRQPSLESCLEEARTHVETLRQGEPEEAGMGASEKQRDAQPL